MCMPPVREDHKLKRVNFSTSIQPLRDKFYFILGDFSAKIRRSPASTSMVMLRTLTILEAIETIIDSDQRNFLQR